MTAIQKISARAWVQNVDDERDIENGIIVMLRDGWEFIFDPGCGTRGFDTPSEALKETGRQFVRKVG